MTIPTPVVQQPIYYLTTVVYGRLPIFVRPSFVIPIYDSLNYYCWNYDLRLLGYVIMLDHLHLLLWPRGESSVADFMRDFKTFTSKRIIRQAEVERRVEWLESFEKAGAETGRSDNKVWQDGYWDVHVYSERFVRQKLNYIHRNPLRRGLVEKPEEYPYSSYRNYVLGEEWLIEVERGWS